MERKKKYEIHSKLISFIFKSRYIINKYNQNQSLVSIILIVLVITRKEQKFFDKFSIKILDLILNKNIFIILRIHT